MGIESGNKSDLKFYGKQAKVEDNLKAIELLKKNHIHITYGFICFNPYTTFDRIKDNLQFLKKSSLNFNLETVRSSLKVVPQIALKEKLQQDGLLYDNFSYDCSGDEYNFQNPLIGHYVHLLQLIKCDPNITNIDDQIEMDMIYVERNFKNRVEIDKIYKKINELRKKRMAYTYDFMMDSIALCESKSKDLETYLLDNQFMKYDQEMVKLFLEFKKRFIIDESINFS